MQISDGKFAQKWAGNVREVCGWWRKGVGFKGCGGGMMGW